MGDSVSSIFADNRDLSERNERKRFQATSHKEKVDY